jgi:cation diffusion facilitator family transporter
MNASGSRLPDNQNHHNHHDHSHGVIDPIIYTSERGIWAIKWSFVGLMITALIQVAVVALSGSVALFADTIHNFGDAFTAIPLWIAFRVVRLKPSKRYPYGYGRVEDLAGLFIVMVILFSAIVAIIESINRFSNPQPLRYLWAVAAAAVLGFVGNEIVAIFRIRVGTEIHSAALIADGYHARIDGLTSLGVLAGVIGVWLGFPLADPVAGLLISAAILRIVWQSAGQVFQRMLDGVDPEVIEQVRHAALRVDRVEEVSEVRARWIGHRLHAEVNLAVGPTLSVDESHTIARDVRHEIMHHLPYLSNAVIHVDPTNKSGESFHQIEVHAHDDHAEHSHP